VYDYTEEDFEEAYFGKDLLRTPDLDSHKYSSIVGYNKSLKERYPVDKYLKYPSLKKVLDKFRDDYEVVGKEGFMIDDPFTAQVGDNFVPEDLYP